MPLPAPFRATLLIVIALVTLAAPAVAMDGIPLSGQVLDVEGRPVAGARVELRPVLPDFEQARADLEGRFHPPAVDRARSGEDGHFRLAAPEAGFWTVAVTAEGFVPQALPVGPLEAARHLPPLRLPEDRGLEVRVLDPAGRPVEGAFVALLGRAPYWPGVPSSQQADRRRALTGADGRATLPRQAGETSRLAVHAAGFPVLEEGLEESVAAPTVQTFRLAASRPRTVAVVDGAAPSAGVRGPGGSAEGTAVPGAVVLLGKSLVPVGLTGEDGRLTVFAPVAGTPALPLATVAPDGRRARGSLAPAPEEKAKEEAAAEETAEAAEPEASPRPPLSPVVLTLEPVVRLSGRVLDPDRRGIAAAWVWRGGHPERPVRTDGRGNFTLELAGPPEDRTLVRADATGYSAGSVLLDQDQLSGARPVTLLLEPTSAIHGRVVDPEGEPVADARVEAVESSRRGRFGQDGAHAVSGPDGHFRLPELLSETTYVLTVRRPGYATGKREATAPAAGTAREGLEVVLHPGLTAFGTVLDLDERPVREAAVQLQAVPEGSDPRAWFGPPGDAESHEARTRPDGTWEVEDLAPGRYGLRVEARGFAPLEVPGIELPPGRDRADLGTVLLEPGAVLEGRVVDDAGTPVADARVDARPTDRRMGARRSPMAGGREPVTSDLDGRFRVEDLVRGQRVEVVVKKSGYAEARVPGVTVPPEPPLVIALEAAATLSGVVVDEDGDPVAGASIGIRAQGGGLGGLGGSFASGNSDEEGRFTVQNVPPGDLVVTVSARGFQTLEKTGLQVERGQDLEDQRFVLEPGALVAGRVLDASGRPVPEALVQVLQDDSARRLGRFSSASSDADGNYLLEGVSPGPRSFAAEHGDHVRAVRDLEVVAGENRLDFRLEAGSRVSGRVVDEGGSPVAGAVIGTSRTGGHLGFGRSDVTSDDSGAFELEGLEPGTYTLTARKEGYAGATLEDVQVGPAPLSGLELRMERGALVTGRLLGVELNDLANATVMAGDAGGQRLAAMGTVDYEGRYRVEGLTPGDWTLVASLGEGKAAAIERITLEPGQAELYRDIDLGAGYTVSGRVLLGEEPVVGAMVTMMGQEQARAGLTRTDHRGAFELPGLEGGTYRLLVAGMGGPGSHQQDVEVRGDQQITIRIPVAPVTGRVTSTTGDLLVGAEVYLDAVDVGETGFGQPVRTGEDGRFRFPSAPEGRYRVRAEMEGHAPGEVAVEVRDGLPVDGIEIRLEPSGGLVLQVTTPSGRPPFRVRVAGLDPAAAPPPGQPLRAAFTDQVTLGEGGRVRLGRVPAGTWRLLVAGDGTAVTEVTATSPGPPVAVSLPAAGTLAVTVTPLTDAGQLGEVRVLGSDGRPFVQLGWNGQPYSTFDLLLGRTRVDGLPAGTWTVEATTPAGDRWTAQARVVPGSETPVVLE